MNEGHVSSQLLEDSLGMGEDKRLIIIGTQASHPAIKKLDGLCTRRNLAPRVPDDHPNEFLHESAPGFRILIHELLGSKKVL